LLYVHIDHMLFLKLPFINAYMFIIRHALCQTYVYMILERTS